jgi:hypothetical protein
MRILKDRMLSAGPIWRRIIKRAFGVDNKGLVMQQAVSGAAAGDMAVSGIKLNDHIVGVIQVTTTTAALVDLTSEFAITSDGVINNTGGTSSATHDVLVTWEAFDD